MKKLSKGLILLSVITTVIGVGSVIKNETSINEQITQQEVQAYNHNPSNILDNVFIENNTRYLPFIFKNKEQTITEAKIKSEFSKSGLTIKTISTGNKIGTGTKITTNNNMVYNVIVYGDVTGDGKVNLIDAQNLILNFIEPATKKLQGIYAKAGNVNNNTSSVNLVDAQRVILFALGELKTDLVTVEPKSAKELDKQKPVIKLNGNATITLEVGSTYKDAGATATDNYDGTITNKIVKNGTVDTKKVGTYTITYNVTDSNGNVANTVKRTVKIVDTTKPEIKLIGDAKITIKINTSYKDAGATATDNYDGTITNKIIRTGTVDTTKLGTYTIKYNVTDSNKNAANTVTRTVVVEDGIDKITIQKPSKTIYNYQEATTLDLTDAKVNVIMLSKTTKTVDITSSDVKISSYNLSTAGTKTITVTYQNKYTATFNVTVLPKITALELTDEGRENISTDNEYQTNSQENFALGVIQSTNSSGSKLQLDQLQITKAVTSSENSEATANDLNITKTQYSDGKILLKGYAQKPGIYTIKASIKYEGEQAIDYTITLNVVKSNKVGKISLETIENEVRANLVKPIQKALTIYNIHNEEIEIKANMLQIKNIPEEVTITKLDGSGNKIEADEEDITVVKNIGISTTITSATEGLQFTLIADEIEQIITFNIGENSIIKQIKINEGNKVPISMENVNILPISFLNQEENEIENVKASNIILADTSNISTALTSLESGQVAIIVPDGITAILYAEKESQDENNMISVYTGGDPIIPNSDEYIKEIGFSITTSESVEIKLSSFKDKILQVIYYGDTVAQKLSDIEIQYNTIKDLTFTINSGLQSTGINIYETYIGEGITLGTIKQSDENEQSLTTDMLTQKIVQGNENGIEIYYETDESGNVIVKANITKRDKYEIKIFLNENENVSETINLNAILDVTRVEFISCIQAGQTQTIDFKAFNSKGTAVEGITINDVEIDSTNAYVTIEPLTEEGTDIIKQLKITASSNLASTDVSTVNITFDFYNGSPITKQVTIEK